jgi:toxin ParE2
MKAVRLISLAEEELYEAQAVGLGSDFLDTVVWGLDEIRRHPGRWPIYIANVRRRQLRRFPFALYYQNLPQEIRVLAVAHMHRRPSYWQGRG